MCNSSLRVPMSMLALLGCVPASATTSPLTLWYQSPAADWEREALPIGNGALGAMIAGDVDVERLQFNEKSLWTGGPGAKGGYDSGIPQQSLAPAVRAIAERIDSQSQLPPEEVAKHLGRKITGYGDYQNFGELVLEFAASSGAVSNYRRELDLQGALARVSYERNGVRYSRDYFASYPDGVVVMRLSADRPGQISLAAKFSVPPNRSSRSQSYGCRLQIAGSLNDNGLRYAAAAQLRHEGGRCDDRGAIVTVTDADAVDIVLGAGTDYRLRYPDYRGADPVAALRSRINGASARSWPQLLQRHTDDYRGLFDRVTFELGGGDSELSTDRLLAQYGSGNAAADRTLESLYFQYGRYLLIASSRAGSLPANLQGVWNHAITPPWNADYHVNINLQMNYWPAEPTNLAETTEPLFDFIDALAVPGARSARQIAGAGGWTAFLNTNIWGFAGVIDWPTAFWQPEAGAWLAQHYYEHYRYTRDEKFLRMRAWPIMKGAAQFWLDALRVDGRDGKLVVSPSYSPEQGPFTAGAAMSQQIVFDLFTNVVEAAPRVGESAFGAQVKSALTRLDPGIRIGSWGQLQEWKTDLDDRGNEHRHASHLFALHPGRQISVDATPDAAAAARISLDARGDGGTGWSKAWKINFWARLRDGERAHKLLGEQLRGSTLPNLFDNHPPFQIDGNFGATAGIAEMLLQGQQDEIHLLPALPKVWADGSVRGLRARGDVTVDMQWRDAELAEAVLQVAKTGPVSLRVANLVQRYTLFDGQSGAAIATFGAGDRQTFLASTDHRYVLRRSR